MPITELDFIQNEDGTTNLTGSFSEIMNQFNDLANIPNYRPDLKAAEAQRLAQKSICLTGELIARFEVVESLIMRKREADKQLAADVKKTIH